MSVIFSNSQIAIFEDFSYIDGPLSYSGQWQDCAPANSEKIKRALLARSYGLEVPVPAPEFAVPAKHPPLATVEEIEAAVASLRFVEKRDAGPAITKWVSYHPEDCCCSECPSRPVYSDTQRQFEPGWEISCPETWFLSPERRVIRLMLPDGSKTFEIHLSGNGSGITISPARALQFGAPAWIAVDAGGKSAKHSEQWEAQREKEKNDLIAQLKKEFGLE